MKRLLLLLAASGLTTTPAFAQHTGHEGHQMPGMTMPEPKAPAKKKAAPKNQPAKKPAAKKAPTTKAKTGSKATTDKPATDVPAGHQMPADHAGHDMQSTEPAPGAPSGHEMMTMPMDGEHAGHGAATAPAGPEHTGHEMTTMAVEPPVAPPPAEALQGPEHAADTVFGTPAMEASRTFLLTKEHGRITASKLLINQLETRIQKGRNGYFLNGQGWIGGDIDKFWFKTEIEGSFGEDAEQAEVQALWSHAIDPWFNLQAGVRLDAEPRTRGRLVLGIEGLAPYWFEVDGAVFLSDKGDITMRAEGEYDLRITQKLILQPRAEVDFALQDIPREQVGSGLSIIDVGLRLRYQFVPQFAPYVGINYERAVGDTRRFRRLAGDDAGGIQFVAGVRAWF